MTDDVNKILSERGNTHGDFSTNTRIMQTIKREMRAEPKWAILKDHQAEALDMIAHKIGRILAGDPNFKDHWDDIAGYATLVADRCAQPATQWTSKEIAKMNPTNKPAVTRSVIKPKAKFCVLCDHTTSQVHVNAAGYCMCSRPGCPHIGKKVM